MGKDNTNTNQASKEVKASKEEKAPKAPTLAEANNKAQASFNNSSSVDEVVAILMANKGKPMTPAEIALKLGDTADKDQIRRIVFQKSLGLSKKRQAVVEYTRLGAKKPNWIWLLKQNGKNAYACTPVGGTVK